MGVPISSFKIAIVQPKKTPKSSGPKRVSNKIVYGTIIEPEEGVYKVSISCNDKEEILDFTAQSFEIVGRTEVFTKKKDKEGRRTRVIRDVWSAKSHPGSTDQYTPFTRNWIVKGYIVKDGLVRLFDFKELVGLKGYTVIQHDDD